MTPRGPENITSEHRNGAGCHEHTRSRTDGEIRVETTRDEKHVIEVTDFHGRWDPRNVYDKSNES